MNSDPQTRLVVQARLASLAFASQGVAPCTLLAGASDALASALPANTLAPALEDERPRFGKTTLGEWSEVAAVARQAEGPASPGRDSWCGGSRAGCR